MTSRNSGASSAPTPPPEANHQSAPPAELSGQGLAEIIASAVKEGVTAGVQAGLAAHAATQKVEELPPVDPAEVQSELAGQLDERRFLITIQKGDKESVDPVPIGVNGLLRSVKRGDFAVVTDSMLGVLRDSEETHIDPETHEPYQVSSYPYTVHAEVPRDMWDLALEDVKARLLPDRVARPH